SIKLIHFKFISWTACIFLCVWYICVLYIIGLLLGVEHLEINSAEEKLLEDLESYDEDLGKAVRLQRRGTRSPSRCIPHQKSCLGHHLPCCNPCDTCYCRFFKAFCYCRSMDNTCKHEYA
uniref:Agouti-related protein n=1 Tax=Sinocyclocheilus rhinocerous TaxID=307959 RepID=A0A673M3W6_9TELE